MRLDLRSARHEQENEGERLRENCPARQKSEPHAALPAHNFLQVQGAESHDHRHDRESHRELVRDHLRRRANPAEQRPSIVRGPSCKRDAVHAKADRREQIERAGVEVGRLETDAMAGNRNRVAKRDHDERDHHREQRQERRQRVQKFVRAGRNEVFLGEHFDRVGDGGVDDSEVGHPHALAESGQRGAIRSDSVLDQRAALALEIEQEQRQTQSGQDHQDRFDRAGD